MRRQLLLTAFTLGAALALLVKHEFVVDPLVDRIESQEARTRGAMIAVRQLSQVAAAHQEASEKCEATRCLCRHPSSLAEAPDR